MNKKIVYCIYCICILICISSTANIFFHLFEFMFSGHFINGESPQLSMWLALISGSLWYVIQNKTDLIEENKKLKLK